MKGKFIIAFDTICEGHQTGNDENNNPPLYDSEADALFEMFGDAIAGLKGTDDDYFKENEMDKDKVLLTMNTLFEEGDSEKMRNFFDANPECNYYDEFIVKAEDFIKGYKTIFTM